MARLDTINRQIIELLQRDGRMSMTDMARHVGRSETTVRDRLASLHASGILLGYQALVDEKALGYGVRAFVRGRCGRRQIPQVQARLEAIPHVRSVAVTGASRPILLEVQVNALEDLVEPLQQRLAQAGLTDIQVEPVLRTILVRRAVPATEAPKTAARPPQPQAPWTFRDGAAPEKRHMAVQ